jgi:hypothetical protein
VSPVNRMMHLTPCPIGGILCSMRTPEQVAAYSSALMLYKQECKTYHKARVQYQQKIQHSEIEELIYLKTEKQYRDACKVFSRAREQFQYVGPTEQPGGTSKNVVHEIRRQAAMRDIEITPQLLEDIAKHKAALESYGVAAGASSVLSPDGDASGEADSFYSSGT